MVTIIAYDLNKILTPIVKKNAKTQKRKNRIPTKRQYTNNKVQNKVTKNNNKFVEKIYKMKIFSLQKFLKLKIFFTDWAHIHQQQDFPKYVTLQQHQP